MFKFVKNSVKTIESRTIWIQNCLVDLIPPKYNVQTSKKRTKIKKDPAFFHVNVRAVILSFLRFNRT